MKQRKPWEAHWESVRDLRTGGQGTARVVVKIGDPARKEYVLKTLNRPDIAERRRRMYREVASLQTLNVNGVPRLIESNAAEYAGKEPLYLVSEFIEGPPLDEAVPPACAASEGFTFFARLLEIIDLCHRSDVLHRDLKPDNILLRGGKWSDPVVVDFGQSFNEEEEPVSATWTGQQLGNRFLVLPELQSGGGSHRDTRSDLTSCCGLFYFVLTGEIPRLLRDEQGKKPHQTPRGLAAMARLDEGSRSRALQLFDVAFEYQLNDRWQSVDALKAHVHGQGKSSVADDLTRLCKDLSSSTAWSARDQFMSIYPSIFKRIETVHDQLKAALSSHQFMPIRGEACRDLSGPSALRAFGFHPHSQPKGVNFVTHCHLSPTGEFIVEVEETQFGRARTEVFRAPLKIAAGAPGLEEAVGKYMITAIRESYLL